MLQIITDSTCDLTPQLLEQYRISIIPLYVLMEGKSYIDGVEIGLQDLFKSVKATGVLPKTSAASLGDFHRKFTDSGEAVYIGISSQLSATVRNAQMAAEEIHSPQIQVVDSLNLSSAIGMLALRAAEFRDQGLTAAEIAHRVKSLIPLMRTSFTIETLDYLYKGGRCSAMENIFGSLLHIRPIIAVRPDGTLGVQAKARGTRQKALKLMLSDLEKDAQRVDLDRVFITHTGCDSDAEMLKGEILRIAPVREVHITLAGSVIGSHCGPDTIGVLYQLKETAS